MTRVSAGAPCLGRSPWTLRPPLRPCCPEPPYLCNRSATRKCHRVCRQQPLGEQTPSQELGGTLPAVTQPESDGAPQRCPMAFPEDSSSVETGPARRRCAHQSGRWPPQCPGLCSASRMQQSPCRPPASVVVTATRPPLRRGGPTGPGPPSGSPVEALVCLRWAPSCTARGGASLLL